MKIVLVCSSLLQLTVPCRGCGSKNEISLEERNSDSIRILLDVDMCGFYMSVAVQGGWHGICLNNFCTDEEF